MLDLLGVALPDRFCKLEAGNQPLPKPLKGIGTPRLARGDKLHHKFAVIDNRKVITGSFNWSPSAAHTNDETLLVIESPQLTVSMNGLIITWKILNMVDRLSLSDTDERAKVITK